MLTVPAVPSETICLNPSTEAEIARVASTHPGDVRALVDSAREAQHQWASTPISQRLQVIDRWRRTIAGEVDEWVEQLAIEIGKPRNESLGELISTLDAIRWTIRNARRALADQRLGAGHQRLMFLSNARLSWRPLGVIGMIGTWNYPLLLNAPVIAQALAAGNGVVWKPSELAAPAGRRLQESLETAGFPKGLVSSVYGDSEVGRALIESGIDKGVFTGGVEHGRKVLAELGALGIPALAELSGFDPAIVLADADIASSARSLAWGAFTGAGQTCVAVKRIYVVGDARRWAEALSSEAHSLRVGDPSSERIDVGPMISKAARERFHGQVRSAIQAGAKILAGAAPIDRPGWFYAPTVLLAQDRRPEEALAGCFGPIAVVRGVATADEAVSEANASVHALAASVWGRDGRSAQRIGERLEAGMISVNDAVTPSAHAAAPFGGCKASGFGRTRGALGLREFAVPQTLQVRPSKGFRPQLYPYSDRGLRLFRAYLQFFHRP